MILQQVTAIHLLQNNIGRQSKFRVMKLSMISISFLFFSISETISIKKYLIFSIFWKEKIVFRKKSDILIVFFEVSNHFELFETNFGKIMWVYLYVCVSRYWPFSKATASILKIEKPFYLNLIEIVFISLPARRSSKTFFVIGRKVLISNKILKF